MQLPDRANLRHLRDQTKDLVRSGAAATLADATVPNRATVGLSELDQTQAAR